MSMDNETRTKKNLNNKNKKIVKSKRTKYKAKANVYFTVGKIDLGLELKFVLQMFRYNFFNVIKSLVQLFRTLVLFIY